MPFFFSSCSQLCVSDLPHQLGSSKRHNGAQEVYCQCSKDAQLLALFVRLISILLRIRLIMVLIPWSKPHATLACLGVLLIRRYPKQGKVQFALLMHLPRIWQSLRFLTYGFVDPIIVFFFTALLCLSIAVHSAYNFAVTFFVSMELSKRLFLTKSIGYISNDDRYRFCNLFFNFETRLDLNELKNLYAS